MTHRDPETYDGSDLSLADIERGQRIKQARIKANFSTGQLAKAMDLTPGSVSQWESGRTRPNRERLKRLCELLNCSPAWIEGRSHESETNRGATRRFVPLISIERAARGVAFALEAGENIGPQNGVQIHRACSESAFAVTIDSDRHRPDVSNGAILVIDPELTDAIQELDVLFVTHRGRPELVQAFHSDPQVHALKGLLETELEPTIRKQLVAIAEVVRGRQPAGLIYLRLGDAAKIDASEMRIIGSVIQRTEGRSWAAMTRAVMYFADKEVERIADGLRKVAQDKPELPSLPSTVSDVA
jgi:transcriptional regulator with XRE-family HTH domain